MDYYISRTGPGSSGEAEPRGATEVELDLQKFIQMT